MKVGIYIACGLLLSFQLINAMEAEPATALVAAIPQSPSRTRPALDLATTASTELLQMQLTAVEASKTQLEQRYRELLDKLQQFPAFTGQLEQLNLHVSGNNQLATECVLNMGMLVKSHTSAVMKAEQLAEQYAELVNQRFQQIAQNTSGLDDQKRTIVDLAENVRSHVEAMKNVPKNAESANKIYPSLLEEARNLSSSVRRYYENVQKLNADLKTANDLNAQMRVTEQSQGKLIATLEKQMTICEQQVQAASFHSKQQLYGEFMGVALGTILLWELSKKAMAQDSLQNIQDNLAEFWKKRRKLIKVLTIYSLLSTAASLVIWWILTPEPTTSK